MKILQQNCKHLKHHFYLIRLQLPRVSFKIDSVNRIMYNDTAPAVNWKFLCIKQSNLVNAKELETETLNNDYI